MVEELFDGGVYFIVEVNCDEFEEFVRWVDVGELRVLFVEVYLFVLVQEVFVCSFEQGWCGKVVLEVVV